MSGFRLKINGLTNISYAAAIQESLPFDQSFEVEYLFERQWNRIVVKPILIHSVVIFLVNFPDGDRESMALVYNERDTWSDIEKESTGETAAIGVAIENYYSNRYLPVPPSHLLN
jgi:hypothetical protein